MKDKRTRQTREEAANAMSAQTESPSTAIAEHRPNDVRIRGKSLCVELIGHRSFTELIFLQILGRMPSADQTAMIDACLVALMEHGLTPSVLAARLTYASAPEALQGAVAAGLLGVGSRFVGSMEGCAALLDRITRAAGTEEAEARKVAQEHRAKRQPLPGFGHPTHKPDDPRALRLLELARSRKVADRHIAAIETLSRVVDDVYGRHITINATGAIAAILGDCGVPAEIARGFGLIARCAGLVGHLYEEQQKPSMPAIWEAAERAVPYRAEGDGD
jgi:citrate synthase